MKKPDYYKAVQAAKDILEKNHISAPPIDIQEIVANEGLALGVSTFGEDTDVSGFINLEKKVIIVSAYDSIQRQNFTIAHELGHWIFHQNEIQKDKNLVILYRKNILEEKNYLEQEANCFAANLLVPASFLERYADTSDKELSRIFGVSESVIAYRKRMCNGQKV